MVDKNLINRINQGAGVDRSRSFSSLEEFLDKKTDYKTKLSNRNYNFETVIDKFIINSKARLVAVMRQSISETIDDAQTTRFKGGQMRVDTGFLRASGVASLNSAPIGLTVGRKRQPGEVGKPLPDYAREERYSKGESVNAVLAKLKIGDAFYFGWTARYAKYREAHDGFLETALQKWQSHVDKAVSYFKDKDMRG